MTSFIAQKYLITFSPIYLNIFSKKRKSILKYSFVGTFSMFSKTGFFFKWLISPTFIISSKRLSISLVLSDPKSWSKKVKQGHYCGMFFLLFSDISKFLCLDLESFGAKMESISSRNSSILDIFNFFKIKGFFNNYKT